MVYSLVRDQRGLSWWGHIPWRILFPALENLKLQVTPKFCNLRCSCIEQIIPLPSKQTQQLVTQNSPPSDKWNHAFQNKSPGAFCLNYLWILPPVSVLPFNTICLVSRLSLSRQNDLLLSSWPLQANTLPQRKLWALCFTEDFPNVFDLGLTPLKQGFLTALSGLLSLQSKQGCQNVPGKH